MKPWNKYFFLIVYFLSSCLSLEDSSNEIIQEFINENGKKAVLFIKYGGATVGNSLQVSIITNDDKIKKTEIGNIFIADNNKETIKEDEVKISWKHLDTLEIVYRKNLRAFKKESQMLGVAILYREAE